MDQSIHIEVICNELISFLKKGPKNQKIQFVKDCQNPEKFDFVFLDPPYESEIYEITQELLLSKEWIK